MDLDGALALLVDQPDCSLDVAELALLVARDEYPALDIDGYLSELDAMAHEARHYVRGSLEARVHGLCRYLFHEMGFHGNVQDYFDPRNSYLNDVIDRRTGIPITLAVIAMGVGRRAGLDIVGIGLPGHVVVKACGCSGEVLFDPFHAGRRLTPELCEQLVCKTTGMTFHATPEQLQALPLAPLIVRMLTNLNGIYARTGDVCRTIRVLRRLRQLCPANPQYLRDLGLSMLCVGQSGKAIDPLSEYLASAPTDESDVKQLLERARRDVANWN